MNWALEIDRHIIKQLRRIPYKDAVKIRIVIKALVSDPYEGDIKKMAGEDDSWRKRVGARRIFYEVRTRQRVIIVYDVKRRTSHTY